MPAPRSRAAELFGQRVREARIALGMSQEDIANLADMHVTHYGRVERGEANSELHTIVRIATALDVDPGTLMAGLYGTEMLPDRSRAYSVADFLAARRAHETR
ncbi:MULTISPECIES: helix-turn-helix domain-containing protein [unclassified Leifsonia]|uniref:helix-turn-helix domain-containing protein n=1 Tax=unclassified Leifsonia TaxID=2663824 RepID=UPI0003675A0A|nr:MULTISPECIES: helix-turn-helix transcriptional regulator [unclassified Leifsonia]TDP99156.1 transcriptional regulator with XRE-family HTH domain [Leifsonia sp. 115AMFTsu3.1]